MVWLIVAALVVLPLVVLGSAVAGVRLRLAELRRVVDLAQERATTARQRLTARATTLAGTLAELEEAVASLRPRRTEPGSGRLARR